MDSVFVASQGLFILKMDEESQKEIRCTNTITNNDYALPNPKLLKWAHSTCSKHELNRAMRDKSITAIEADIVWGHEENGEEDASLTLNPDEQLQPIMAHPPSFISDLTFERFIATAFAKDHDSAEVDEYKHLKLDFKDAETIEPVLERLQDALSTSKNDKTIFLNADILEGPGKRNAPLIIEADEFVEKCLTFIDLVGDQNDRMAMRISLSLGWRGDCRSFGGYTVDDIEKMRELIDKYDILKRCGGKNISHEFFLTKGTFTCIIGLNSHLLRSIIFFRLGSSSKC